VRAKLKMSTQLFLIIVGMNCFKFFCCYSQVKFSAVFFLRCFFLISRFAVLMFQSILSILRVLWHL